MILLTIINLRTYVCTLSARCDIVDTTYYSGNGYHPPPSYSNISESYYHPYPYPHPGFQIHSGTHSSEQQGATHPYKSELFEQASQYNARRDSLFNQFDMMRLTRHHQPYHPSFSFTQNSRQNHYNFYPYPSSTPFYLNQAGLCGGQSFDPATFSSRDSGDVGNAASGKSSRKEKNDKICGVCGDRALSYNFDAISCESCKAFFRRNAPKNLVSSIKFNQVRFSLSILHC